jgi:hypothetical protein
MLSLSQCAFVGEGATVAHTEAHAAVIDAGLDLSPMHGAHSRRHGCSRIDGDGDSSGGSGPQQSGAALCSQMKCADLMHSDNGPQAQDGEEKQCPKLGRQPNGSLCQRIVSSEQSLHHSRCFPRSTARQPRDDTVQGSKGERLPGSTVCAESEAAASPSREKPRGALAAALMNISARSRGRSGTTISNSTLGKAEPGFSKGDGLLDLVSDIAQGSGDLRGSNPGCIAHMEDGEGGSALAGLTQQETPQAGTTIVFTADALHSRSDTGCTPSLNSLAARGSPHVEPPSLLPLRASSDSQSNRCNFSGATSPVLLLEDTAHERDRKSGGVPVSVTGDAVEWQSMRLLEVDKREGQLGSAALTGKRSVDSPDEADVSPLHSTRAVAGGAVCSEQVSLFGDMEPLSSHTMVYPADAAGGPPAKQRRRLVAALGQHAGGEISVVRVAPALSGSHGGTCSQQGTSGLDAGAQSPAKALSLLVGAQEKGLRFRSPGRPDRLLRSPLVPPSWSPLRPGLTQPSAAVLAAVDGACARQSSDEGMHVGTHDCIARSAEGPESPRKESSPCKPQHEVTHNNQEQSKALLQANHPKSTRLGSRRHDGVVVMTGLQVGSGETDMIEDDAILRPGGAVDVDDYGGSNTAAAADASCTSVGAASATAKTKVALSQGPLDFVCEASLEEPESISARPSATAQHAHAGLQPHSTEIEEILEGTCWAGVPWRRATDGSFVVPTDVAGMHARRLAMRTAAKACRKSHLPSTGFKVSSLQVCI